MDVLSINHDEDLQQWVDDQFDEYYVEMKNEPPQKMAFEVKENEKRLGVITFTVFSNWISVHDIVVVKESAGKGIGSILLDHVESLGRSKNCIGCVLSTISYQAPDFYKKRGYEVFAKLEPYAHNHQKIYLKKTFAGNA